MLGFNIQDEGPSIFYLYGDKPDNLIIERDYEGPAEDVESVPEFQAKPLEKQLKDVLFPQEKENKFIDTNDNVIDENAGDWDLPKLIKHKKRDSNFSVLGLLDKYCMHISM